ncbi:uncharacterized protein LOC123873434 [Maniola jurtina]|uniref:uncharacterized protein LOC123873434 n=1 Tax=Maniola jurtina TaxID=191418 RepID=UPI001E68C5EC|nr:uncharacterized protein LOC123873434 [Maniola jurtina]
MAGQAIIIINEFLTFVQNKLDILDEQSITQICSTNFTDAEIEAGKSILYNSCGDKVRHVQRKGEDKKKRNIKDVIRLLKEVDPDAQPNFVAKDINRLPPVSFDHVDVTRLLKDMTGMKNELSEFQTKMSAELAEIRNSVVEQIQKLNMTTPKKRNSSLIPLTPPSLVSAQEPTLATTARSSITPNYRNNVHKRVSPTSPSKSLPLVAVPPPARTHAPCTEVAHTPTYRDIVFKTARPRQANSARMARVTSGQSSVSADAEPVIARPASSYKETMPDDKNASFTVVVNKFKTRKLRNMRGTSDTQCKIQVADTQCSIYISRAQKSVSVDNILEHIADMGEECISVEQLKQRNETSFNSFKVTIPTRKLDIFLDGKFWPAGLVYRRYKERYTKNATKYNR